MAAWTRTRNGQRAQAQHVAGLPGPPFVRAAHAPGGVWRGGVAEAPDRERGAGCALAGRGTPKVEHSRGRRAPRFGAAGRRRRRYSVMACSLGSAGLLPRVATAAPFLSRIRFRAVTRATTAGPSVRHAVRPPIRGEASACCWTLAAALPAAPASSPTQRDKGAAASPGRGQRPTAARVAKRQARSAPTYLRREIVRTPSAPKWTELGVARSFSHRRGGRAPCPCPCSGVCVAAPPRAEPV